MDNDAAHHAAIAMRMHLTGDYVNLVDQGADYLDKPHLHFWLAALSFKIFGVHSFAYKLPSLLFAVLGVFSTYKLGARLYSADVGRLSALMLATSFGFLLSVSDVRMDAILVSCIAFSLWQLILVTDSRKWRNVLGAAAGLALGFASKGHIAVFVPAVFILIYLAWKKELYQLLSIRWLAIPVFFLVLISPVLYCYYLQFNLHPEKAVRGRSNIDGVRFMLFDQALERIRGRMEKETNHDPLFFFHAFLPAFAPWSVLAYIAMVDRIKRWRQLRREYASAMLFIFVCILVTISSYQLPHYLNILFPTTATLSSAFLLLHAPTGKWSRALIVMQLSICFLLLAAAAFLNAWAFPVRNTWVIVGVILLLALVIYFLKTTLLGLLQRMIAVSAATMLFFFFLMNVNFYPALLRYQAGKTLADTSSHITSREPIYVWEGTHSSSFHFYSKTFRNPFHDSLLAEGKKIWLLFDEREMSNIEMKYRLTGRFYATDDFEITMLTIPFLNPATRSEQCSKLVLSQIEPL